ncbi:hypothetical protein K1719_043364 [Acacia pycnantha]|nr:hypothetical protein K1719_043364 [Acacia pycnantha]
MVAVAPATTEEGQEAGMAIDQVEDHREAVVEEASVTNRSLTMIVLGARTDGEGVMAGEDLIEEEEVFQSEFYEICLLMSLISISYCYNYSYEFPSRNGELTNFATGSNLKSYPGYRDFPIPRPDSGGTLENRTSKLRVNHFPIRFSPDAMLMHYNFDVKPTSTDS